MNKLTIAAVAIACGAVLASAPVRAETSRGGPTHIGNKCFTHWAGEAKDGREAVGLALGLLPKVVIMDIAMPFLNGLQATQQITARSSATRVLILSAHPDPEYIEQALKCGASGYLIKQSAPDDLIQAIRRVQEGKTFFSASISKGLRDQCIKAFGKAELIRNNATHSSLSGEDLPLHNEGEEKRYDIEKN